MFLLKLGLLEATVNDTTLGQGVVVLQLKNMKLVKGELVLSIKLQDINISVFLAEWQNSSVKNKLWDGMGSKVRCSQIASNWGQFLQDQETQNRVKRGALDFGGDILKSLFGVSTEKRCTPWRADWMKRSKHTR